MGDRPLALGPGIPGTARKPDPCAKVWASTGGCITLLAFAIGSSFGGLAGALVAPLVQFIEPASFALVHSLRILLMVVVGGAGYFFGPILGAGVVILLPEVLRFTEGYYLIIYSFAGHRADDLLPDRLDRPLRARPRQDPAAASKVRGDLQQGAQLP